MTDTTTTATSMSPIAGTGSRKGIVLWAASDHPSEGKIIPAYLLPGITGDLGPKMGEEMTWAEYAHDLEDRLVPSVKDGTEEPAQLPADLDPAWGPFVPGGMEVTYFEWSFWAREESYPPVAWEEIDLKTFAGHMAGKEADDHHNWVEDAARGYV
jgi:hypothetical protein